LRATNSSPGAASKIICGSARLSEQAISIVRGDWPLRLNSSNRARCGAQVAERKRR
jgi:hypothetical protein